MFHFSENPFIPFNYPSQMYQGPHMPNHYSQPFYPSQQQLFSPMQSVPQSPLNLKTNRPPFINAFLKEDGSFDFEKTFKTVHQISNTFQQISPLMKEISAFFKIVK